MAKPDTCFELSLSNPRVSEPNSNHFHNILQNTNNCNGNSLFHSFQKNQYTQPHHKQNRLHNHHPVLFQPQQQEGLSQELGFLRPIRGIPVYRNPPPFPFSQQTLDNTCSQDASLATTNNTSATTLSPYRSQGLMRSRFMSRFPAKRSMRAPRMRWTTTLHARFVHAVELLGGHESICFILFLSFSLTFFSSFSFLSFQNFFSFLLSPFLFISLPSSIT
jgi:hypothetical protein